MAPSDRGLLVLDSGGVSFLAERSARALALLGRLRVDGPWPPVVPSVVLVESLRGQPRHDVSTNRFLRLCDVVQDLPEALARRAAALRTRAGRGSAVDAVVVASAVHGGTVVTSDARDMHALAAHAVDVEVLAIRPPATVPRPAHRTRPRDVQRPVAGG